jgi:hypothetical protein
MSARSAFCVSMSILLPIGAALTCGSAANAESKPTATCHRHVTKPTPSKNARLITCKSRPIKRMGSLVVVLFGGLMDNGFYAVRRVTVGFGGRAPQQTFRGIKAEPPASHKFPFVVFEDMNFDGHLDFGVFELLPASPNTSYLHFIWNPKKHRFVRNHELDKVVSAEFDAKKKLIYSVWRDGCCLHGTDVYRWQGDRLINISRVERKDDPEPCTMIYWKRRGGKLVKVRTEPCKVEKN